jgi:flagellar biosynthetic protein FliO
LKNLASNRLLWVVLGVVFVAMLGMGAVTSQMSSQATPRPSPQASVSASAEAEASRPSAPFLTEYKDPQPQAAPNTLMTVVGLIVKLAVVIGLIYLTILGLRYFSNRGRRAFLGSNAINVLEKTALAQNRELYLIDVADKVLLLGATANSITVLTEITDPEALEELRAKPQPALPSAEPFLTYLKSAKAAPADVFKRIEEHRDRIRQRTAASLLETSA